MPRQFWLSIPWPAINLGVHKSKLAWTSETDEAYLNLLGNRFKFLSIPLTMNRDVLVTVIAGGQFMVSGKLDSMVWITG